MPTFSNVFSDSGSDMRPQDDGRDGDSDAGTASFQSFGASDDSSDTSSDASTDQGALLGADSGDGGLIYTPQPEE